MTPIIRATAHSEAAKAKLAGVSAGLSRQAIQVLTQRVAGQVFAEIVAATPVRWFGQVRAAWRFIPTPTGAIIRNDSRIFKFLDQGTRDHGPVRARFLYIPKTKAAAAGWRAGLKRGIDYILTKRVRGIKALHLIDRFRSRSRERLLIEAKQYIRELIAGQGNIPPSGLAASVPSVLNSSAPLSSGLATKIPTSLIR
jgi:hypothetical protein